MSIQWVNDDFGANVHRSGWKQVAKHLKIALSSMTFTEDFILDLYIDATFSWRESLFESQGIIPYKKDWIGFIHHTVTGCNNSKELFQNHNFITSLEHCKCIIVLSENLRKDLLTLCPRKVPIYVLTHPTETPDLKFTMGKFVSNTEKRLLHVGNWMRDISHFQWIPCNTFYTKTVLTSIRNDYIYLKGYPFLELLEYLPDTEYDEILSENMVCIFLKDASAINTILECVVRDCPIIVNSLPAVREVLGDDYPLYVSTSSEVESKATNLSLVSKAYTHIKRMNKTRFTFEYFIDRFKEKLKDHFYYEERHCVICLESLTSHEAGTRILNCNHEFGKSCIEDWLRRGERICPICRNRELPQPVRRNGEVYSPPPQGVWNTYYGHGYYNIR